MSQDDLSSLPATVEELQQLLLDARQQMATAQREAALQKQKNVELSATVASQTQRLEKSERTIRELLAALKGKTRERIDPNQLLLFDLGELERMIEEQAAEADETAAAQKKDGRRKKRSHGRRIIPDNLPREEVLHELPEQDRLCPIDGQPMPVIRYETSEQLEFEPAKLKVIVHKRAVYACPQKHDEATLITAPKPPQPIEKGLAGPGLLSAMVVGKFGRHSAVCWSYRSVAVPERKLVQVGNADSAITCRVIAWKRSCSGTEPTFGEPRFTTGCQPSPI